MADFVINEKAGIPQDKKSVLEAALSKPELAASRIIIDKANQRNWLSPMTAPQEAPQDVSGVEAFSRGALDTMTAGLGKYAVAGALTPVAKAAQFLGLTPEDENTFKNLMETLKEQKIGADQLHPTLNKTGEITGFVFPGGAFMKGLGIINKVVKGGGAIGRAAKMGAVSGVYEGVRSLSDEGNVKEAGKAAGEGALTGAAFGAVGEALMAGGKLAKKFASNVLPKVFSSIRGNLSPETVKLYSGAKKEISELIEEGIEPVRRRFSGEINETLESYINKQRDVVKEALAGKGKQNVKPIVDVVDKEIERLGKTLKLGDTQARSGIKQLEAYKKKFEGEIDSEMINEAKKIAQDLASPSYEFSKIGRSPQLARSFKNIAREWKNVEGAVGGESAEVANANLKKAIDLQKKLNIKNIFTGEGLAPEQFQRVSARLKGKSPKGLTELRAAQELDKLAGTGIMERGKKLNAIQELSNTDIISASPNGRSLLIPFLARSAIGGIIGAVAGDDYKSGGKTGALIGAALAAPGFSRPIITGASKSLGLMGGIGSAVGKTIPLATRAGLGLKLTGNK